MYYDIMAELKYLLTALAFIGLCGLPYITIFVAFEIAIAQPERMKWVLLPAAKSPTLIFLFLFVVSLVPQCLVVLRTVKLFADPQNQGTSFPLVYGMSQSLFLVAMMILNISILISYAWFYNFLASLFSS